MTVWKQFEIDCTKYLNNIFGAYATFIHQGGEDSIANDILAKTQTGKLFFIEAKHCPAQCGQFVLKPNLLTQTFEYSEQNQTRLNKYAEMIIAHMDKAFGEFNEAGTAGKEIKIESGSQIFANWVMQTYRDKEVAFIITNDYTILPIEFFLDYFDITAKYRIKKSGSSHIGKNKINLVMNYVSSHNFGITNTRIEDSKLFVATEQNLQNLKFTFQGAEYMFSIRGTEYEVRKLSNTRNANVIFSIKRKNAKAGLSMEEFVKALN